VTIIWLHLLLLLLLLMMKTKLSVLQPLLDPGYPAPKVIMCRVALAMATMSFMVTQSPLKS
jgi:hypothetical protein